MAEEDVGEFLVGGLVLFGRFLAGVLAGGVKLPDGVLEGGLMGGVGIGWEEGF